MENNYRFLQVLYLIVCFNYLQPATSHAQPVERIDRLRNKAEKLCVQGDYTQALTYYLDGYNLARRLDPVRAANLTVDISSIYHMQGDFRRGAAICQAGVALMSRATTQPDSVWFKLNSSLGEMYKKLNNQDSCYLYFSRANAILQKHPDLENRISEYVIYHYNNQGMMYVRTGGYTEGLSYLTKALSIAEKHTTSKEDIAILQNNLGEVCEQLGEFGKALVLRKSAVKNYPKEDSYKCKIYNGVSKDALQSKLYKESILYAKKAKSLARSIAQPTTIQATIRTLILALNCLGKCAYMTGNYTQAEYYFNLEILHSKHYDNSKENGIPDSYLGLAQTFRMQGHLDKALLYCQQSILSSGNGFTSTNFPTNPTPEEILSEQSLFEALILKSELLSQRFNSTKKINDLHKSYATYEYALAVADAMRKSYNALETKWFFATQVRPAYLHAFEAAYSLYQHTHKPADEEQAFRLLERSKAAALADMTRELLIKPANVPATLITQERELQRTITAQKLESSSAPSAKHIDAQIQLAQLQKRLEKEFPTYYQAKYQPQQVPVAQVQAALGEHTAYLSYLLASDALYIAVVTQDGLTLVRKNGDLNALKASLNALTTALYTNPGLGNYMGTSAAITGYRWLIEPVVHLLEDTKRLIISPDGDLHRLPFEVLETGRIADDFLIKKYAISYVPSANALLNPPNESLTDTKNTLLGLAPFVKPINPKASPISLSYLPASQAEVEQLPGEILLGKAATKQRFMRAYANSTILHLATHAYANDVEPARSYIAFYPDGTPDKLYTEEIHNLSLPHTRLVMLSACETGSGKLQAGEGIMSLAQAFAYAGCPSVLSTLWSAHDESMAYLSQRLYEHLQAGLPVDVALQKARLDYFQSPLYQKLNHPHYWANLTLMGNSRPVYAAPWPMTGLVVTGLVLLLCVGGLLVVRHRGFMGRVVAG